MTPLHCTPTAAEEEEADEKLRKLMSVSASIWGVKSYTMTQMGG